MSLSSKISVMSVSVTAIANKVLETIKREQLIKSGERVVVGLSGGADSCALLDILHSLTSELKIELAAAHLHHGMRGDAADADVEFCRDFAESRNAEFTVGYADIYDMAKKQKITVEEAGRIARYQFFDETLTKIKANRIATAHHKNDRVETVLFNILRGCGLHGLAGIPYHRDNVIRPLLDINRTEIEAYCSEKDIQPRWDITNDDMTKSRNIIRNQLLPIIRRSINADVDDAVTRLSELSAADSKYLNKLASEWLENHQNESQVFLSNDFANLPDPLLNRVIRLLIKQNGSLTDVDYNLIKITADSIRSSGPFCVTFPHSNRQFTRTKKDEQINCFQVIDFRKSPEAPRYQLELTPGKTTVTPCGRWQFTMVEHEPNNYLREKGSFEQVLDKDKIKGKVILRNKITGERMTLLGMQGSKKLSDIFNQAKIANNIRASYPIVSDDEGAIWVPGAAVSDRIKVTRETKNAVMICVFVRHC